MNREISIALHLARVMGKPLHQIGDQLLMLSDDGDPRPTAWSPHENLSQWAECVLWAAMNGMCPMIDSVACWAAKDHQDTIISVCDNTQSSIQAATLEAIARATSWEESK